MVKGETKLRRNSGGDWQNSNGTITLGEVVKVSDPRYGDDTWCSGKLTDVLPGEYECSHALMDEGDWGIRVSGIRVVHKDYLGTIPDIKMSEIDVGVDSGQCGIFDYDYYMQYHTAEDDDEEWYERICGLTYGKKKNINYIPFEESEFYKPIYKDLTLGGRDCIELQERESRIRLLVEMEKARVQYGNTRVGSPMTYYFDANTTDGKGYVSASGDGDGSYTCAIARNDDNKIVAIELIYLTDGYDDEEED